MPVFSATSKCHLEGCDPRLIRVCEGVIPYFDFTILCGHRTELKQMEAYHAALSRLPYPQSKHNSFPSLAVDIAPYPIDWEDYQRFYYLAGLMQATARGMNIPLRWGGDWNRNGIFIDQSFNDLVHFELC